MIAYIENTEIYQINEAMVHLKLPEKHEQAKVKTSKRIEMIKIQAKINDIETKKIKTKQNKKNQRINETKSWFIEKVNKIDEPIPNLTKFGMK
jgi:hypothetical protein